MMEESFSLNVYPLSMGVGSDLESGSGPLGADVADYEVNCLTLHVKDAHHDGREVSRLNITQLRNGRLLIESKGVLSQTLSLA